MRKIILVILTMICGSSYAQIVIKGRITDHAKEPVASANISIAEVGSKTIAAYAMSDSKGGYEIRYTGGKDSIAITVSGFNLKKESRTIVSRSQTLNLQMESETIMLKEVKIKPPKIRQTGDTLNYLVDSFSDVNDRTIGDVLKKMPGIEVQDNGAILYQNKPINKFYIENLDALQGRYGIATNNIQAKDVSTVQVMENHQPIRALKDNVLSEDAAINLKLKDSAKGVFTANAQLGIGAPSLLLSNELTGLYFTKKRQDIIVYKGDNSGRDVTRELNSFYSNEAYKMGNNKLLGVQGPATPAISLQRQLFNDAHVASLNDFRKLSKDYTFTTNINYLFDRPEKNSMSFTDYYLPNDSTLSVSEKAYSIAYKSRLGADFQINANVDKYYFNNLLKLEGEWDRERGAAVAGDSVYQRLRTPVYGISNTFDLVKNKDKNTIKFASFIGYKDISQSLRVQPLLYKDLFGTTTKTGSMLQDFDMSTFSTRNSFSWGKNSHLFKSLLSQSYRIGFNAELQGFDTQLNAEHNRNAIAVADSLRNKYQRNTFEWVFTPSYNYGIGKRISLSLNLPVNYTLVHQNDKLENKKDDKSYLFINPSLFINYKMSPFVTSMLSYRYNNNIGGMQNIYTGYVMTSYRSLMRNDGRQNTLKSQNVSLNLNYKNPLTTLFAYLGAQYSNTHSNLLDDYIYQGILRVKSSIDQPNTAHVYSLFGNMGRDIDALKSTLSFGGSYNVTASKQLSQGIVSDFESKTYSLSSRLKSNLSSKMNIQYDLRLMWNSSKIEYEKSKHPSIRTLTQKAWLNIYPVKKLVITLSFENFYNNGVESGSRSMWFGDFSAKYKWKDIELMLDYTNIFNTGRYETAAYSNIGRYYYAYELRPSEVLLKARFKLK